MPKTARSGSSIDRRKVPGEFTVQLGTAGRFVIPSAIRDSLELSEGDELRVRVRGERILISKGSADLANAKELLRSARDSDD